MKRIMFVLLLLLIPSVIAVNSVDQDLYMQLEISGKLDVEKTDVNYVLDYISANYTLFPKETEYQEILELSIQPGVKMGDSINFKWDEYQESLIFNIDAKIKKSNDFTKIKRKVLFPIDDYPEYTHPSDKIDSDNSDIINMAKLLTKDEDDLYEAVYKIAKWIREEINYSLDSLTADAVQKPSWVLDNRYGVCDEITGLFIAMSRSVGIPARYVSGLAFTNYNKLNDWEGHAWAEVYFPNFGWVPFDITYDQLGYVDSSHIILLKSLDPSSTVTKYEWKARHIDVQANPINFNVFLEDQIYNPKTRAHIEVEIAKDKVSFGSYNMITIHLENLNDYYITETLQISVPQELEIKNSKVDVFLRPNEARNINILLKVPSLDKGYTYEFPVSVFNSKNKSFELNFESSQKDPFYDSDYFELTEEVVSPDVSFSCVSDKLGYSLDEKPLISCKVESNKDLDGLTVDNSGKSYSISDEVEFVIDLINPNKRSYTFMLEPLGLKSIIDISVQDIPSVTITEIKGPSQVEYYDLFTLEAFISKESIGEIKDVLVDVSFNKVSNDYRLGDLNSDQKFVLELSGSKLKEGMNVITFTALDSTNSIEVELINLNFWQKFFVWLKNI